MHEHDLDDLAMIAACYERLVARAIERSDGPERNDVATAAAETLTALCVMYGASVAKVKQRIAQLRARSRAPQAQAVH